MHGSDYECVLRVIRGKKIKRIDNLEKIALNGSIILKWTLKIVRTSRLIHLARSTVQYRFSKPSMWFGHRHVWSAYGQHAIQYTECTMNKHTYINYMYNCLCILQYIM
jgi:hypothetical protein